MGPEPQTGPWSDLIVEPVRQMLEQLIGYLPKLLGALIILILGWIVARIIRRIIDELLKAVHFDVLADKAGVTGVLVKGNLKITAREVVSGLVYWLIMIMVFVVTVGALGLPQASDILGSVFAYVPKVIAALLVIIVGLFLAGFVADIVRVAAGNSNIPKPEMLAGICRWAIIIFAAAIALNELDIASVFVTTTFDIILAGICLAAALAVGLGSKDAVAKYLDEACKKHCDKKG